MKSELWQQVDELFHAGLERKPEDRAAFLDEQCAGDDALRQQVNALLTAHEDAGSFIERPALEVEAQSLAKDKSNSPPGSMIEQAIGHYRVIALLGSGGMGEVYLARDNVLRRQVALKLLPHEFTKDADRLRRFLQEAHTASALNHPNIITIHEIGVQGNIHFIATEFIKGETLRERLETRPVNINETLNIASQIAAALDAAHQSGIVHRDIKPDNIMLREDGLVKVLDFGLAKLTETRVDALIDTEATTRAQVRTTPGLVMGTVAYMSPEQARGFTVDARTDIFSFGAVLYEMLTGRSPFAGETKSDIIAAILKAEPEPLSEKTPAGLQAIVQKCLEKIADERYQTAKELLIDLNGLKHDLDFSADLERSGIPDRAKGSVPTRNQGVRITASAEYIVSQVRLHKLATVVMVGVLALAAAGAVLWYRNHTRAARDSVAVLPFTFSAEDNSPSDPEAEYVSDGLTESVINSLSQSSSLRVIARASVFLYKGKQIDPQQVGRDLGVRTVFVGRITRHGDKIIIKAELSDVLDNRQIWGEQYERKSSDLLVLQREIARDIINNLRLKLGQDEQNRLNKSYTDSDEAYELYLKGRYYWNKRTEDGFREAIDFFQKAIEKDPSYAQAYTGLADTYMLLSDWGFLTPTEGYSKARDAVGRALIIDDQLAEAHNSLAGIKTVLDWDWPGAESEYRKAITLNPNYSTAYHWYALQLMLMGRADESLAEIKQAQRLDPLSLGINKDFAVLLVWARRYDDALEQCRKTLEIDSSFLTMYPAMAQAYEGKQMYSEAIAQLQKAHGWLPDDPEISISLAQAFALVGMKNEAQRILDELEKLPKQHQSLPNEMALLYALLGNKDRAFEILQSAYENHYFVVSEVKIDPRFEVLRSDSRYADLLRRIRLQ